MSRAARKFLGLGIVAVLIPTLLAGCGSDANQTALADTKAPAQLLRNEIASRVPPAVVEKLADSEDSSEGCGQDGVMRSWRSTQMMFVEPQSAWRISTVLEDVTTSLADQGWTSKLSDASSNIHEVRLTSDSNESVIHLTAVEASDEDGNGATMEVTVNGPCVATDGPDSDEVKHLEGRE
jgi:hypothetical protein